LSESTTDIHIVPLPTGQDILTEVFREGARRMLAKAIEAEVAAWIDAHAHLKDQAGRQQVIRNGHLPEQTIQIGIEAVEVKQPRVRDRRPADEREAFTSAILPPYLRKTWSLEGLIPWLYLEGVSTSDFADALQAILGPDAPGGGRRRPSPSSRQPGKPGTRRGASGRWRASITSTSGPTAALQHPAGGRPPAHPGADGGDGRGEEGADRYR
jgi:hypothetical protein